MMSGGAYVCVEAEAGIPNRMVLSWDYRREGKVRNELQSEEWMRFWGRRRVQECRKHILKYKVDNNTKHGQILVSSSLC